MSSEGVWLYARYKCKKAEYRKTRSSFNLVIDSGGITQYQETGKQENRKQEKKTVTLPGTKGLDPNNPPLADRLTTNNEKSAAGGETNNENGLFKKRRIYT
ncbi:MAG: hypothetical protein L6Q59_07020 [Ignavibacteriaceae bacterium]|nr:hypothetical protein [Ignavibacteriaceae bacterium]MCK6615984.1 hypothetical protein [Ignavibacteriaceae bacterium]